MRNVRGLRWPHYLAGMESKLRGYSSTSNKTLPLHFDETKRALLTPVRYKQQLQRTQTTVFLKNNARSNNMTSQVCLTAFLFLLSFLYVWKNRQYRIGRSQGLRAEVNLL